ncbi:MAG: hypothetical protein ACXWKQ_03090, partial [Reyranella sp.]
MALPAEGGLASTKPQSEFYTPAILVLLAGVPVLVSVWALLSPRLVLSYEMTWDFVYNLSGAWRLQYGDVAHIDFHEPVGQLNFVLTRLGFELVGPTPFAFLVGATIVAAVVFVTLLVLMPANVGDKPNAYSFAMSYNRYGWSVLSILALILFVPPHDRVGYWIDVANAGLLLVALFYLKVTYFAGGVALGGLALLISPHIRAHLPVWLTVGTLIVANAVAPWNHPYLLDILHAAAAGAVRNSLSFHLNNFFANAEGYAAYAAGLVVAVWMWARGLAPLRLPLAIAGILAIGLFVLSQNHQSHGLPVGIVIAFLLYDQMRERFGPAAPALMVFPLFAIGASAISLAGYHSNAGREELLQVVDRTQLKGLAVPAERAGLLAAFSDGQFGPALLNRSRAKRPRFELSSAE